MAGEFKSYKGANKFRLYLTVNHLKKEYVKEPIETGLLKAFKYSYCKYNLGQSFNKLKELRLC